MDTQLLAAIDFKKMYYYRGFGKIALANFKKILVRHSVLEDMDDLEVNSAEGPTNNDQRITPSSHQNYTQKQ